METPIVLIPGRAAVALQWVTFLFSSSMFVILAEAGWEHSIFLKIMTLVMFTQMIFGAGMIWPGRLETTLLRDEMELRCGFFTRRIRRSSIKGVKRDFGVHFNTRLRILFEKNAPDGTSINRIMLSGGSDRKTLEDWLEG